MIFLRKYSSFLDALSFCYYHPTDPLVLLYVRCKSGVFFARRRFRDECVDKMLSNNTFLETRIQQPLDDFIFVGKGLGAHVQLMLKMCRGLYTGGIFKQNTWKKSEGKWGTLFEIKI